MVNRARPTHNKRERERAKQERHKEKAARRAEAKVRRANAPPRQPGQDPDLAGIVPGPQPSPWADELKDDEDEEHESSR
jgi:hypothetical protein